MRKLKSKVANLVCKVNQFEARLTLFKRILKVAQPDFVREQIFVFTGNCSYNLKVSEHMRCV